MTVTVLAPFLSTIYRNSYKPLLSTSPSNLAATARLCCSSHSHSHSHSHSPGNKQKIVVIIGPTGCGKSRLSIDLATRFFPAEVINSDKIQIYKGLDITTNKMPMPQRLGVPHHLLGDFEPSDRRPLFTPSDFRTAGDSAISDICSRGKLPLIVGGSNSFIHALLANQFHPETDVFHDTNPAPVCPELRYDCCFLRIGVSFPVLDRYLVNRVDEMMGSGMLEELAEFFASPEAESPAVVGLRKAIGVQEFEAYFREFGTDATDFRGNEFLSRAYEKAVKEIKDNTCQLARKQVSKILRLRNGGRWHMYDVVTTEALRAAMNAAAEEEENATEIWERQVVESSVKIVKRFLDTQQA